jgi:RNA polymerase sigma-70 factor (sigma-E family)
MTTGGYDATRTDEDELVARWYRQVADGQAARYAASYDLDAGLDRFNRLVREHARAGAEPALEEPGPDSDQVMAELYTRHYQSLVRLADALIDDLSEAEEVVGDAFGAMHAGWRRLRDPRDALNFLRQAVVNRSRSVLRHRAVAGGAQQQPPPARTESSEGIFGRAEPQAVAAALRDLPARQNEVVALRYYAGLSETEIAAALGISRGAVKSHMARGIAMLKASLGL